MEMVTLTLAIDGDAVRRARFILAAIATSHGTLFVIEDTEVLLEVAVDLLGDFGHTVFFNQRENGGFDGRQTRMQLHHHSRLHFPFVVRRLVLGTPRSTALGLIGSKVCDFDRGRMPSPHSMLMRGERSDESTGA